MTLPDVDRANPHPISNSPVINFIDPFNNSHRPPCFSGPGPQLQVEKEPPRTRPAARRPGRSLIAEDGHDGRESESDREVRSTQPLHRGAPRGRSQVVLSQGAAELADAPGHLEGKGRTRRPQDLTAAVSPPSASGRRRAVSPPSVSGRQAREPVMMPPSAHGRMHVESGTRRLASSLAPLRLQPPHRGAPWWMQPSASPQRGRGTADSRPHGRDTVNTANTINSGVGSPDSTINPHPQLNKSLLFNLNTHDCILILATALITVAVMSAVSYVMGDVPSGPPWDPAGNVPFRTWVRELHAWLNVTGSRLQPSQQAAAIQLGL